jgi:hypothetical protein
LLGKLPNSRERGWRTFLLYGVSVIKCVVYVEYLLIIQGK